MTRSSSLVACSAVQFLKIIVFVIYLLTTMTYFNTSGSSLLFILFCYFLSFFCDFREPIRYSREFLLFLHNSEGGMVDLLMAFSVEVIRPDPTEANREWISKPKKVRKRGSRGGVWQRLKRQGDRRMPLPMVMLAKVQSLRNKLDEFQANVKFLKEYSSACLLAFMKTWLLRNKILIPIWN